MTILLCLNKYCIRCLYSFPYFLTDIYLVSQLTLLLGNKSRQSKMSSFAHPAKPPLTIISVWLWNNDFGSWFDVLQFTMVNGMICIWIIILTIILTNVKWISNLDWLPVWLFRTTFRWNIFQINLKYCYGLLLALLHCFVENILGEMWPVTVSQMGYYEGKMAEGRTVYGWSLCRKGGIKMQ